MKAAWFHIEGITDSLFESLRRHMLKRAFDQGSTQGFRLEEARTTYLSGAYIEKTEFIERITDPFGEAREIARLRYEVTHFRINRKYPELEIIDYPRSIRGVVSELSIGLKHEVSIERCDVSVQPWLDAVARRFKKVEVRKLVVSALPVATGVTAQIVFVGDRDIRNDSIVFLRNRGGMLIKACFIIEVAGTQVLCELNRQGRASFQAKEDDIIEALRDALAELRADD